MKKKLFSEKRKKESLQQYKKRQSLMWECVRRNKDYLRDFQVYGNRELDRDEKEILLNKWNIGTMPFLMDPNYPITEEDDEILMAFPLPDSPAEKKSYFSDVFGVNKVSGQIAGPGQIVTEYEGIKPRIGKQRKIEHWGLFNFKTEKYEKLTEENCPRSISIHIEIKPWFSKKTIEERFMEEFEEAYQKVKEAQQAILGKKQRRPGDDEFQKCIHVYDLKKNHSNMSWSDIAEEVIPKCSFDNPNKRGKRKRLVYQWAIDKVRDYYALADNLINKEGWRQL